MKTTHNLGQISAITLSNFILKHFGPMSHLKLQKLLFYCEAYHLAYFEQSLIPEEFEAWVHGPVCRVVYNSLRDESVLHSDVGFDFFKDVNPDKDISALASSQQELLNQILKDLSSWTAIELEDATHNEKPWIDARGGIAPSKICTNVISKKLMMDYYASEINGR